VSDEDSTGSLASSSVIMPRASSQHSQQGGQETAPRASIATTTAASDTGSEDSSISLINDSDVHSELSDDSDDDEVWQDSRSEVTPAHPGDMEYIVLYEEDSASSDDD
jgi:hypothetical protein